MRVIMLSVRTRSWWSHSSILLSMVLRSEFLTGTFFLQSVSTLIINPLIFSVFRLLAFLCPIFSRISVIFPVLLIFQSITKYSRLLRISICFQLFGQNSFCQYGGKY